MYQQILTAAVKLAARDGLYKLTRSAVAKAAKVAPGSVSYHFDGMGGLLEAVVDTALKTSNFDVLSTCLQHPRVQDCAPQIRAQIARYAAGLN